jgi:glycosyltransferase involved in cell wall biosynthesis
VHVVLPNDIDDPAAPSGGNSYDRRVCTGLGKLGWAVTEHAAYGGWPDPSDGERAALAGILAGLPDGAPVLVDGLIGSAVPDVLAPEAARLALVMLVHVPLGTEAERAALGTARAVVATSPWTRDRLAERYGLTASVATPGVEAAELAAGSPDGGRLLCVAALWPHKGQDLLTEALATLADLPFTCTYAGSLERDPGFVAVLRDQIEAAGLTERIRLPGPLVGPDLDAAYASADLLVLPSRGETYGMVVTEALARGLPVVATDAGGLPAALGRTPDGRVPGLLIPPGDGAALTAALRSWLTDADLRERLRGAARAGRTGLDGWTTTAERISTVLAGVR